jgi:hypothetical protein
MTLANRVAIISGSGRGIGREMARLFSSEGARIVVADIDAESAGAVAAEINAAGHVARATTVDVGDPAQVDRLRPHPDPPVRRAQIDRRRGVVPGVGRIELRRRTRPERRRGIPGRRTDVRPRRRRHPVG